MKAKLLFLVAAAALAAPAFAQSEGQCIVAGRLSDGRWAPQFAGVQLLGGNGQALGGGKQALAGVRQARLAEPALLSHCNGNQSLASADHEPAGTKTRVPAVSRGVLDVEAISYPKLRTGGELVELRVRVPSDRVVMVSR